MTMPPTPAAPAVPVPLPPEKPEPFWVTVRTRLLEGLLVVLPLLVTIWVFVWFYSLLEKNVIDPIASFVLWKTRVISSPELPYWFEYVAAPIISLVIAVVVVYVCGVLAHSQLRKSIDRFFLRVPLVSHIYDGVQGVLKCFDKQGDQQISPQRMVLIQFPHPGTKLPAIVTSSCRDIATGRTLLCVYVPTTPVPASGFFLMVPEDETTELNWDVQQAMQAIISGGLSAPREVSYFKAGGASTLPVPPPEPTAAPAEGR